MPLWSRVPSFQAKNLYRYSKFAFFTFPLPDIFSNDLAEVVLEAEDFVK